jgi:hypothetical protein
MKTATLHAVIGSLAALIMAINIGTASAAPLTVTTGITGTTAPVASSILPVGYYGHGYGYGRGYGHGYGYGYGHRRYYGHRHYYRRYNYYPGAYYGYRRYYRPYNDCYNW